MKLKLALIVAKDNQGHLIIEEADDDIILSIEKCSKNAVEMTIPKDRFYKALWRGNFIQSM